MAAPSIPGLAYVQGFLGGPEQASLLAEVDRLPWLDDLKRRVQHHGWRYDYKRRLVTQDLYLGPLPGFLAALAARLVGPGRFGATPDQVSRFMFGIDASS